ncbi:ABC transporter substrate-binding protein [Petroclostridium sp. X23]|uniref:ABC transporter substrate-binding protein n=1 Tax=Petroclostridium sp. X23 TaxID=3045146 RepID=UPI0024AD5AB0|nr:ABC transporter substrate-binding protein [Petroclostridium sp. X23]WHH60995.1 ABC transporter substrate-binding protein [Petroclostridium sp. X23]
MVRVLVHCPLNISRSLEEMLKEFGREMEQKHKVEIEVITQPHRPTEEGLFQMYLKDDRMPELIIGHVNDFADLPAGFLEENFRSLPDRFPMRKELVDAGFTDAKGFFQPFVVIPFAMFYNPNLLEENNIPDSWEDLLQTRWRKQILMPDEYRMVSKIIRTFMQAHYLDRFADFQNNVIHEGAPIDVVNGVDEGRYPLGITNIAFARISRNKNTRLIWPRDGIFCMPQVMVWSKKADDRLLEIGDFLLSKQVQEYLALQTFVPASPEVAIPKILAEHHLHLRWESWEHYLSVIKGAGE